ncbi:DEAD/DEAH box helicase [Omnitrophica bacterium]|nr:DEAD/DEAH box helicase [Candidatus Omnitrophota bacterium]
MDFELDLFQKQAIALIEKDTSVLVSAPTGAGKTVIAESAIWQALSQNQKVIYTAPIKALSNQKYRDFKAIFGESQVGILTGDVQINRDAPILIMTTEIYRNSLFEDRRRIQNIAWIIFDEIHYLDDPQRGTVWEEALLFTPPEINILALSATVPNVHQLADWIRTIHQRPIEVIEETHRPVPLDFYYQCQGRIFHTLEQLKKQGYLNRPNWKLTFRERRRRIEIPRARPNRLDTLLKFIHEKNYLPVIYFAFGRRQTENMAWEASHFNFITAKERTEITETFDGLLERFDLQNESSAVAMRPLVTQGIAYHHAGMLPSLKEIIEQLFTSRLMKLIFTTETFALGINMPARCVIFDQLEKFYGTHFDYLSTRDFYQMAGRAGRRGKDEQGYVITRLNPHHVPLPQVERILFGKPDRIQSQLNTAYATLMSLYKQLGPKLLEIYPRTFHHFQSVKKERYAGRKLLESKLALLAEMEYIEGLSSPDVSSIGLTSKGAFASSLFGYELPLAELFEDGFLEKLDEDDLNVLISGLIYEPRKGDLKPRLKPPHEKLRKKSDYMMRHIYYMEHKYQVHPYTKPAHFNLANAVQAWSQGRSFDEILKLTNADEGEIVRHLRMIMQLLREIMHASGAPEVLRVRAGNARKLINRDVVDAEKQMRA